jgi:hypothetical protein
VNQPNEAQLRTALQRQLDNYRKNLLSCPEAQKLAFRLLIEQAERELESLSNPQYSTQPGNRPPAGPPAIS